MGGHAPSKPAGLQTTNASSEGKIWSFLLLMIMPAGFVSLSGTSHHSLYLKSDGSLWAMGYSGSGQLGDGTTKWYVH